MCRAISTPESASRASPIGPDPVRAGFVDDFNALTLGKFEQYVYNDQRACRSLQSVVDSLIYLISRRIIFPPLRGYGSTMNYIVIILLHAYRDLSI